MYFALKVMMRSFKYSHALTPSIAATAHCFFSAWLPGVTQLVKGQEERKIGRK